MNLFNILKLKLPTPLVYLVMVLLGVLSGLSGIPSLQNFGLAISNIFIRIFSCISTPIIALAIIVTLSSRLEGGVMSQVWRKTMYYTTSTTMVAAMVSCILYLIIHPSNISQIIENSNFSAGVQPSYLQHLINIIPTNVFAPFIEHQVLGVLLVGIITGLAIRYIPDQEAKFAVTNFFKGMYGIFLVMTKWIVAILPLGLYGFITATVVELSKDTNILGIGEYLLVVVLANIIQGFIVLPIWLKLNHINPFTAMKKMMPALTIAFFSKSSAGTLPVTMDTAEKRLGINPKISRFVLPLCTSLNMNGCAAFIFTTVIYLMQNNGIPITIESMCCWVLIATIAAIGNAGVPMGCYFLSASLLSSMNVPIVLLGIILPFYNVIDMIETALNVWSDSCVATVVNRKFASIESESTPLPDVAILAYEEI